MAELLQPLPDPELRYRFVEIKLRSQPDLPEHLLGQIQWLNFSEYPGYYIWDNERNTNLPVEFIQNHWYYVTRFEDKGDSYISHRDRIDPYSNNTGYWRITDLEHQC